MEHKALLVLSTKLVNLILTTFVWMAIPFQRMLVVKLFLDPDPRSGDAAGDLIIRGNLQVAGTTTTVNSTEMTVNDPVFNIGDTTSEKAITLQAPSSGTTLNVDNPSGIATGGLVTGTNIGGGGRTINQIEVVFQHCCWI